VPRNLLMKFGDSPRVFFREFQASEKVFCTPVQVACFFPGFLLVFPTLASISPCWRSTPWFLAPQLRFVFPVLSVPIFPRLIHGVLTPNASFPQVLAVITRLLEAKRLFFFTGFSSVLTLLNTRFPFPRLPPKTPLGHQPISLDLTLLAFF